MYCTMVLIPFVAMITWYLVVYSILCSHCCNMCLETDRNSVFVFGRKYVSNYIQLL